MRSWTPGDPLPSRVPWSRLMAKRFKWTVSEKPAFSLISFQPKVRSFLRSAGVLRVDTLAQTAVAITGLPQG